MLQNKLQFLCRELLHSRQISLRKIHSIIQHERSIHQRLNTLYNTKHNSNCIKSISNKDMLNLSRHFTATSKLCTTEDSKTKALTVWSNVKELKRSPVPALSLGMSGLIPFIAAPVYMMSSNLYMADVALGQLAYGACILSFIGGVRWGFTIPEDNPVRPDWVNLVYSVTPSLIAWTGLLLPSPFSWFTVMGGLTFAGYCDMAMYGYPPWFKGLRFILTFVAIMSLWTTFMCSLLLEKEKEQSSKTES